MAIEIIGVAVIVLGVGRLSGPEPGPRRRRTRAGRGDRLRWRPPAGADRLVRIAEQSPAVRPRARDWTAATGHALLNWLLDLACLAHARTWSA